MSETSYACCACNAVPHGADWGVNGLICYGSCNGVALYDPDYRKIGKLVATLHKHSGRVNVARWLRRSDRTPETELISASTDGTAIIWTLEGKQYVPSCLEDGNPLTIADGIYLGSVDSANPELLVCIGSTEGTFDLWHRDQTRNLKKIQRLTFGRNIPTTARLSFLPRSDIPLIAIALDDCSIRLHCRNSAGDFVPVQTVHNHEDWITCMDFTRDLLGNCLLATGSQDSSVRLWRIYSDESSRDEAPMDESQRRIKRFSMGESRYAVTLESILAGHEHWVYGVHWHPGVFAADAPPALLSCAMDKSMIIWEADEKAGGIWRETIRVGEVGGNSLGFYGCKYAPDGLGIMAHGYHGSFHLWRYDEKEGAWLTRTGPTGHFSGVVDLCWDPKGRYLMSASLDQTTRVHAAWEIDSGEVWHEIGRPQVHGYDMSCLASLGSYTFASGAEEKVVRIFTAPKTFRKYLSTVASSKDEDDHQESETTEEASVPALGLTNKAVFDGSNIDSEERVRDLDYSRPPNEEELIRHTLWPELEKLYGHGYEIFSMASRSDGKRLATGCKSANAENSGIIVWCTKTWSRIQKLTSHRLTVTQMAFSPNNDYLIAVSRDRRFSLHRCDEQDNYELVATSSTKNNPLHSRIIWCCAWTHDSKYFATGSRDGKIGLWRPQPETVENGQFATSKEIKDSSVTALAFAPRTYSHNSYVLAVGYDSGCVDVWKIVFAEDNVEWRIYARYDSSRAHHSTVKRLAFRPIRYSGEDEVEQVASCGLDHALKIHDLPIDELRAL